MRHLKQMIGVLMLAAVAAMLVAAMGTSTAGASEFKSAGGFPVTFLGEGLGLSTFKSANDNLVVCHNSHSKGSVVSATLATDVLITYLTGCELIAKSPLSFKEACPNILTKALDIKPVSKINGGTKPGLLIASESGTIATFTCSGSNKVEVKVTGSVICESTPFASGEVSTGKVICKQKGNEEGVQEFTTGEISQTGAKVTAGLTAESTDGIFKFTEKDSQTTTEDVTYSKAIEQTA